MIGYATGYRIGMWIVDHIPEPVIARLAKRRELRKCRVCLGYGATEGCYECSRYRETP